MTTDSKPAFDVDTDTLPNCVRVAAIDAYLGFAKDGSIWLGAYMRPGEKYMRHPQEFAFEYNETAVSEILEKATVFTLNGALIEAAEELEKIKDILMKALKQHFLDKFEEGKLHD